MPRHRNYTDLGNAERIADAGEDRLKYCPQVEDWLSWNGVRWRFDEHRGVALRVAKKIARGIYAEATAADDARDRAALSSWAVKSENAARLHAAVDLARSDQRLLVD